MRHALALVAALALAAPLAVAADIPDGSSATIAAVAGTGCLRIANASGERVYYLPTHEVVGVQSKSNGCSVTMRTDKGVETRDFTTITADDFVALMKAAR